MILCYVIPYVLVPNIAVFVLFLEKWYWTDYNKGLIKKKLYAELLYKTAKNVIVFVGSGMSIATLTAARIYKGQQTGRTGENDSLFFERFPNVGLSKVSFNVRPRRIFRKVDCGEKLIRAKSAWTSQYKNV